jgi:YVTN family beta-propeller protein
MCSTEIFVMTLIRASTAMLLTLILGIAHAAQLLVLNKADATLAFVDPDSGQVGATVDTGEGPHEIELSHDGKLAFVSNYGAQNDGHSISVIDVQARKELRRVDLGDLTRPHGLSIAKGQLYFTSEKSRKVGRLDAAALRVEWTFSTDQEGTHMVLASNDGRRLFATNMQSNSVAFLERGASSDQWTQTQVPVGAGPEGLALSPDGRDLWVAHSRDGAISVIDVGTKKVTATVDAGTKRSNRVKFVPDGRLVLVSDLGAGQLVIIDAPSRNVQKRLPLGRAPTGILIPNGQHAYVAVSGENRVAVIDLQRLSIAKTIATGNSPDGLAWMND